MQVFDQTYEAIRTRGSTIDIPSEYSHDALYVLRILELLVHRGFGNARARSDRGGHGDVEHGERDVG
jgi:hypothetical protein